MSKGRITETGNGIKRWSLGSFHHLQIPIVIHLIKIDYREVYPECEGYPINLCSLEQK